MKSKKIFFLILFIFIIMSFKIGFAAENTKLEIDIGEERSFTFSDLTFNGIVPTKIISASSSNEQMLAVSEIETGFWFWEVISEVKIKGVAVGDAQLTITYNYNTTSVDPYTGSMITSTQSGFKIYDVKVIDKTAEEIDDLENKVEDAEETKKEMIDAWKNGPPSAEASVSEIHDFVAGYAMEVSSKSTEEEKNKIKNEFAEKVSIDVAKKWREVLDDAMIDTISRDMYYEERQILDDYIDGNLDSNVIDTSAKEQMDAIDATEKTISEYMELIATIKAAARKEHANFTDVLESIGDYIPTNQDAPTKLINKANIILTIITNIGMILSVIVIAILGIKYMLGSVEEKAEYKKDLIPYFVGAVLLFSIIAIVKILQEFGQSINNI